MDFPDTTVPFVVTVVTQEEAGFQARALHVRRMGIKAEFIVCTTVCTR